MPITPTGHEVILGSGNIIELIEFEVDVNGKRKMFERARRPPGVRLIFEKGGKILLSREYRREQEEYDCRLPGGKVYDTLKEMKESREDLSVAVEEGARKEAIEECGIKVNMMELLSVSKCGANIEWDLYYFLVTDFTETGEHERDDEGEADMTTAWYTLDEVRAMIRNGEMSEDRSIAVLAKRYFL